MYIELVHHGPRQKEEGSVKVKMLVEHGKRQKQEPEPDHAHHAILGAV